MCACSRVGVCPCVRGCFTQSKAIITILTPPQMTRACACVVRARVCVCFPCVLGCLRNLKPSSPIYFLRTWGIVFPIIFFCSDSGIKETDKKRTGRLTTCKSNPDPGTRGSLIIKSKVTTEADFRQLLRSMKRRQLSRERDNTKIAKIDIG